MISYPAMSLGERFCVSRKGRAGGGGCLLLKGANSIAVSRLGHENPWLEPGRPFFLVLSVNRSTRKNSPLTLYSLQFQCSRPICALKRHFDRIVGVVRITLSNVLRTMAECSPMSSLGDGNVTELYVGYAQISYNLRWISNVVWLVKG